MSERMDEARGNIKQGAGKLTGNQRMEREGQAEHDTAAARREAQGAAHRARGRVEEGLGKITGDDEARDRATADRIKGDTQRAG